jgi:uncharacterized membrane protein HdeD (DUF308 family)
MMLIVLLVFAAVAFLIGNYWDLRKPASTAGGWWFSISGVFAVMAGLEFLS